MQLALALSSLATVDGNIAATEVKLLEQVYRALGLEPQLLYSHLHSGRQSAHPLESPALSTSSGTPGYGVDTTRLAALRRETEQVSALLAGVFVEEEMPNAVPAQTPNPASSSETHPQGELLPDLDSKHQRFLADLLQKPSWTRSELKAMAAKMQIMLDGALERINEAAFDLIGEPLTEGDDPVYVQQNILENAE
jgi:TerB-C domain